MIRVTHVVDLGHISIAQLNAGAGLVGFLTYYLYLRKPAPTDIPISLSSPSLLFVPSFAPVFHLLNFLLLRSQNFLR